MEKVWGMELLVGIGRLFINPSLYILIIFSFIFGLRRTKRERKDFHIRIYPYHLEFVEFAISGLGVGLFISIIFIALGIVLPEGFIFLTSILTILFLFTMQPRWLSPAYVVGLSILLSLYLPKLLDEDVFFKNLLLDLSNSPLVVVAILLALLLFAEGSLIIRKGHLHTSPMLKNSKRGKRIGVHEAKKMWLVPVLCFIPGDAITSVFAWWPVLHTPFSTFSLIVVPFSIGFQQQVQASLPKEAIQTTGRRVLLLATVVTVLTIGAYWLPILAVIAAVLSIIGRELISVRQRIWEENHISFFTNQDRGLVILGVIPNSPAEKMALQVGEIITKVNGDTIYKDDDFYQALQKNRLLCKLEVLDHNGEVRFVQRTLYEGEHHELGIIFVPDKKQWTNEAV